MAKIFKRHTHRIIKKCIYFPHDSLANLVVFIGQHKTQMLCGLCFSLRFFFFLFYLFRGACAPALHKFKLKVPPKLTPKLCSDGKRFFSVSICPDYPQVFNLVGGQQIEIYTRIYLNIVQRASRGSRTERFESFSELFSNAPRRTTKEPETPEQIGMKQTHKNRDHTSHSRPKVKSGVKRTFS